MSSDELQRIVRETLETAASSNPANQDEAVHAMRKAVKSARALLKLLGPTHRSDAKALARVGRNLSAFRDAEAILGTFESVVREYPEQLAGAGTAAIRRGLLARKKELVHSANSASLVSRAVRSLRSIARRVVKTPDPDAPIQPGMEKAIRRARKAFRKAREAPEPETLHEWRKRAKEQFHQLNVLDAPGSKKQLARLHKAAALLGEDHNLAVLRDAMLAKPAAFGARRNVENFLTCAADYELALRGKALKLGSKIYRRKG